MAGRKKTTTTIENTEQEVKKEVQPTIDVEALQKQMLEMQKMIAQLQSEKENAVTELAKALKDNDKQNEKDSINSDTEIPVISQTVGTLTLSTEGKGQGIVYNFDKFGDVQDIPFGDLKDICKTNKQFAQQGLFYICNADVVNKLRLNQFYNRMLSEQDMLHLFEKDAKTVIELYKLATDMQKEQILSLVENKILDGERVDMNVVTELEEISGKKFNKE